MFETAEFKVGEHFLPCSRRSVWVSMGYAHLQAKNYSTSGGGITECLHGSGRDCFYGQALEKSSARGSTARREMVSCWRTLAASINIGL